MYTLFVIIHLIVSAILILVVLLQSGKAGDLASAFGGGGSQTAFGSRSATTLLTKVTAIAAVTFMITSLGLSLMSGQGATSTIMEDEPIAQDETAAPAATPVEGVDPAATPADPPPPTSPAEKPPEQKPPDN